jgi:hypothetical protein
MIANAKTTQQRNDQTGLIENGEAIQASNIKTLQHLSEHTCLVANAKTMQQRSGQGDLIENAKTVQRSSGQAFMR